MLEKRLVARAAKRQQCDWIRAMSTPACPHLRQAPKYVRDAGAGHGNMLLATLPGFADIPGGASCMA